MMKDPKFAEMFKNMGGGTTTPPPTGTATDGPVDAEFTDK